MAPPPSTAVSPILALVVRLLTFICLLISLVILATNTATSTDSLGYEIKINFSDFYAYRFMLASMLVGGAYTLLQTALAIFQVSTGNRLGGHSLYLLEFYGDKAISYLLAAGAAAGFGLTVDSNSSPGNDSSTTHFLNKANASASILCLGFLFSAVSSVFSSLSLPKRA